ncbi:MAG: hypothetical protein R3C56_29835 [Pirellulaceae bacterium]
MQTKLLLAVFMVLVLDGLALHPSAGAQDKTTDAELRELWFGVLDAGYYAGFVSVSGIAACGGRTNVAGFC